MKAKLSQLENYKHCSFLFLFFRFLIYLLTDCFSVSKLHLRNAVRERKLLIFN